MKMEVRANRISIVLLGTILLLSLAVLLIFLLYG